MILTSQIRALSRNKGTLLYTVFAGIEGRKVMKLRPVAGPQNYEEGTNVNVTTVFQGVLYPPFGEGGVQDSSETKNKKRAMLYSRLIYRRNFDFSKKTKPILFQKFSLKS